MRALTEIKSVLQGLIGSSKLIGEASSVFAGVNLGDAKEQIREKLVKCSAPELKKTMGWFSRLSTFFDGLSRLSPEVEAEKKAIEKQDKGIETRINTALEGTARSCLLESQLRIKDELPVGEYSFLFEHGDQGSLLTFTVDTEANMDSFIEAVSKVELPIGIGDKLIYNVASLEEKDPDTFSKLETIYLSVKENIQEQNLKALARLRESQKTAGNGEKPLIRLAATG